MIVRNTGIGVTVDRGPLGNGGDGIRVDASPFWGNRVPGGQGISDNVISNNGGAAIMVASPEPASSTFPIDSNTIEDDKDGGIVLNGGANLLITANHISKTPQAIKVAAGTAPDLRGNFIFDNSYGDLIQAPPVKAPAIVHDLTATRTGSELTITGQLPASDVYRYRIDVYGDTSCNQDAQGRYPLGSAVLPFHYVSTTFTTTIGSVPANIGSVVVDPHRCQRDPAWNALEEGPTGRYSNCTSV